MKENQNNLKKKNNFNLLKYIKVKAINFKYKKRTRI